MSTRNSDTIKTDRPFANQLGFTLIEALIAIAIFSIGMLAVAALQTRSLMGTGDVARKTEAWALLDEQVALLKALPFYTNPGSHAFSPELDENGGGFAHRIDRTMNGTYTVHWEVVDDTPLAAVDTTMTALSGLPAGTYSICKEITVVVTRQGQDPLNAGEQLARVQFVKTWAATDL